MNEEIKALRKVMALVEEHCPNVDELHLVIGGLLGRGITALEAWPAVDVEGIKDNLSKLTDTVLYDCVHSLAQPSMQGKSYGEIKEYLAKNVKHIVHAGVDRLAQRGLIGGVPDGYALVPVTRPDTFDNWMCDALYRQAVYSNDIKSQDVWSAVIKEAEKGKGDE